MTALLLAACLSIVPAVAHAEHGTGEDAPDDWEDAWTVDPGTLEGDIAGDQDWYRIEIPEGQALNLSFLATDDDARLTVREDDGRKLGTIQRGVRELAVPTGPALRIGLHSTWRDDPFDYEVQTALDPAPGGDDAGLGSDAGNYWRNASVLPGPGTYSGTFSGDLTDRADWFRIEAGADEWVGIDVTQMASGTDVVVRAPDGTVLDRDTWGSTASFEHTVEDGALLLGFLDEGGDYTVSITRSLRSDLAVDQLAVTPRNVTTDVADVPAGTQRTVDATVANHGPGPSKGAQVRVWVSHGPTVDPAQDRLLHQGPISLKAGQERHLELAWDGTGQVGDATVHAEVTNVFDLDTTDDHRTNRSYVLVGNLGAGADLLNNRHRQPITGIPLLSNGAVTVETSHDVSGTMVHVRPNPPGPVNPHITVTRAPGELVPSVQICEGQYTCYGT